MSMTMQRRDALSAEVKAAIRQLEIKTKRLLRGMLIGESRSAQKGVGFDFDQIREYQMGDDVRFIDWSGSARTGTLLVKQYMQERSRIIIVALDVSRSTLFSSGTDRKNHTMAQVASVLAFVAEYRNDYIGLILFADNVEVYVPPRKGKRHVQNLISLVFTHEPQGVKTCFEGVLKKVAEIRHKNAIVFLISDFIGELPSRYCALLGRLYTMVVVRCLDKYELDFPRIGFVPMVDIETGEQVTIDSREGRTSVRTLLMSRMSEQDAFFKKYGMEVLNISSGKPFVGDMVYFFKRWIR